MKTTVVLGLLLLGAACTQTSEKNTLKEEIDSLHKEYEAARQELLLKKDSAKHTDMSKDAAFLYRLTAAEERAAKLKQEVREKKGEYRTLKKADRPAKPTPATQ